MKNQPHDAGEDPLEASPETSSNDDPRLKLAPEVAERFERLEDKIDRLRAEHEPRDPNQLLTREEAAERLRVSVRTLDTLRAAGELRAVKVKRRVRFHPDALDAYIRRNAEEGQA